MKKLFSWGLSFSVICLLAITISCNREDINADLDAADLQHEIQPITFTSEPIEGQYIVVLNDNAVPAFRGNISYEEKQLFMLEEGQAFLSRHKLSEATIEMTYSSTIKGYAISGLKTEQVEALKMDPAVKFIEQDQTVQLQGGPPGGGGGSCASNNSETTPCGIPLVNGGANYTGTRKAYVLDTGIDLDHADLNVASYGFNAFTSGADGGTLDDLNGHGTHVAGTIAAIGGNGIGVKGVAAGALVVPVKVLDRRGSGSWTGIIAGVDYVGANGAAGDVANMSLGGGASTAVDNAVIAASSGGIWFVIAAGNSSANANNYSPARANGPYIRTIASMTCAGAWSSFSNFGIPPIDWIAPGSSICSTYKDGGYASLSGTSMAAPHAAGVILVKGGAPNTCGSVSHSSGSYPRICIQ
jgi:subtilisin family serine protease